MDKQQLEKRYPVGSHITFRGYRGTTEFAIVTGYTMWTRAAWNVDVLVAGPYPGARTHQRCINPKWIMSCEKK